MKKYPLVSILMPTFNREKLLPEAIDSVVSQTYQRWELLVIDDRSTDDTKQLAEKYAKEDDRIKYLFNEYPKGVAGGRNFGIDNAKGEYISFIDSDDKWLPHHLKDSLNIITAQTLKICFSLWIQELNGQLIYDNVKPDKLQHAIEILKPDIIDNAIIWPKGFYEYSIINRLYCTVVATLVVKKDIFEEVGKFDENLLATADDEFLFRLCHNNNFALIRNYSYLWRWGKDNICAFTNRKDQDKLIYHRKYAIRSRQIIKRHVRQSDKFKDLRGCIIELDRTIAEYCLEIARAYKKDRRLRALYYYVKSVYYNYDPVPLREIRYMLIAGIKNAFASRLS